MTDDLAAAAPPVAAGHRADAAAAAAGDAAYMQRALELAERGRATVSPNPMVGCLLVRDREVVGEGWHERAGGPHAEIVALQAAGDRARGATAYVTLEPCNHTGRTGPCARALAAAGVAKVVVALADPHARAAGGAVALRAAGTPVEVGLLAERAREQNAVFLHSIEHGRPYVILKAATSLDGRIAAADGTSQWLTGPAARDAAHRLRAGVDAVVVGSGTILADDARLTARPRGGQAPRQPLRVVLDARGRTPHSAQVLDAAAPTLVITTAAGRTRLPPTVDTAVVAPAVVAPPFVASGPGGGVDLAAALAVLHDREVRSVLVEGGAQVATALAAADLVDRLVLHVAPLVLGDRGRPLFGAGPTTLAAAPRLRLADVDRAGDDVLLTYTRKDR